MGHGSFDLSHKTLSNNDEKKFRFFVSDYLNSSKEILETSGRARPSSTCCSSDIKNSFKGGVQFG